MKDEIQKIIEMNQAGKITPEQAAELIAELTKGATPSPSSENEEEDDDDFRHWHAKHHRPTSFIEPVADLIRNKITAHASHHGHGHHHHHGHGHHHHHGFHHSSGSSYASESKENSIYLSRFDSPIGEHYTFQDNAINLPSVTELKLNHAKMVDNRIDASKVEGVTVTQSKFIDCKIQGSSFENLSIEHSEVSDTDFLGSKCFGISLVAACRLNDTRINGSVVKNFLITNESHLNDVLIEGSKFSDVHFQKSKFNDFIARGAVLKRVAIVDSDFKDVLIAGGENWLWKKQGFQEVRFENCKFKKVLFSECHLHKTQFKNVTLENEQLKGLNLSGLTIDGNEAFLEAVNRKGK